MGQRVEVTTAEQRVTATPEQTIGVEVTTVEQRVTVLPGIAQRVAVNTTEQRVTVSPIGREGRTGADGAPSSGGDKFYDHWQSTPSATWVIVHNLGKRPSVTVIDSALEEWLVTPVYDSANQLTLNFPGAFSGHAYLN